MFGMCKTKYNNKDHKRCLFIVCTTDIIWSCPKISKLIDYELCKSYKTFFSLKYLLHFFLTSGWLYFLQEYYEE